MVKFLYLLGIDFILLSVANSDNNDILDIKLLATRMETDGIVPDQIDEAPSAKLDITYPNGKVVAIGAELTPTDVKDEPTVAWTADAGRYYTLVMYDPDAPSRSEPTSADVKHWLVVNIPGADVASGEVIAPYIGSGPPKGTGLHRYIFLVYEQRSKGDFSGEPKSAAMSREHRLKWSMSAFRKKYDLGKAHAGNYYQAQYDAYVDEFRKKFTS